MKGLLPQDRPDDVVVVVPARDEERLLPRCLAAVQVACEQVRAAGVRAHVVVVADACSDRTEEIALAGGAHIVRVRSGRIGAVREAGARRGLELVPPDLHRSWIASTDADSVVPAGWLRGQLEHAALGADGYVGTVRLTGRSEGEPPAPDLVPSLERWSHDYLARVGHDLTHPHVHGANLGVRADAYLEVGGFADVELHEDQVLVVLLRAAGRVVVTSAADPVATSHRTLGRLRHGGVAEDVRTA